MDDADQANDTADLFLRIAKAQIAPSHVPDGIGVCINCAEPVPGVARWCNADCRQDWERMQRGRN